MTWQTPLRREIAAHHHFDPTSDSFRRLHKGPAARHRHAAQPAHTVAAVAIATAVPLLKPLLYPTALQIISDHGRTASDVECRDEAPNWGPDSCREAAWPHAGAAAAVDTAGMKKAGLPAALLCTHAQAGDQRNIPHEARQSLGHACGMLQHHAHDVADQFTAHSDSSEAVSGLSDV